MLSLIWSDKYCFKLASCSLVLYLAALASFSCMRLSQIPFAKNLADILSGEVFFSMMAAVPALMAAWITRPSQWYDDDNTKPCASCGYNLNGLTEPRCPECGTPFAEDLLRP